MKKFTRLTLILLLILAMAISIIGCGASSTARRELRKVLLKKVHQAKSTYPEGPLHGLFYGNRAEQTIYVHV